MHIGRYLSRPSYSKPRPAEETTLEAGIALTVSLRQLERFPHFSLGYLYAEVLVRDHRPEPQSLSQLHSLGQRCVDVFQCNSQQRDHARHNTLFGCHAPRSRCTPALSTTAGPLGRNPRWRECDVIQKSPSSTYMRKQSPIAGSISIYMSDLRLSLSSRSCTLHSHAL